MSLDAIFESHHAPLLRLLQLKGVHPSDVEDAALETWIDIQRRLPEERAVFDAIPDPCALAARTRAWVMAFGRRRAMRWVRDRGREKVRVGVVPFDDAMDERDDLESDIERETAFAAVRQALLSMREPWQRELLADIYFADMTHADAARARGWNESKLRRALQQSHRAMERILRRMKVDL